MPVQIKTWACKYRCGKTGSCKQRIVQHEEKQCYRNPAIKACKTCKHNVGIENSPDIGLFGGYDCEADALAKTGPESKARRDCPKWERGQGE